MTLQDVFTLYEYNRWANGRTLDAAEKLDPAAFVKDLKNSFPSVRDTLAHILGAEWVWLHRWRGESGAALLAATDFPTVASLRERFRAVDAERGTFLASLTEERLQRPFDYRDLAGNPMRFPSFRPCSTWSIMGPITGGRSRRCSANSAPRPSAPT